MQTMHTIAEMQYTIRNIPKEVDRVLRRRARQQGRSLNDVLVEALSAAAGVNGVKLPKVKRIDLSDIAGTWVEDPEFDKFLEEKEQIDDPEMWR